MTSVMNQPSAVSPASAAGAATVHASPVAGETTTASAVRMADLLPALAPYGELDIETMAYHARESDATAAEGHWHAAVNEARSLLEALVIGAAVATCGRDPETFRRETHSEACYKKARRLLLEAGFLSAGDHDVLVHVHGLVSGSGSHPRVVDGEDGNYCLELIAVTVRYLIRRYASWRSVQFTPTPPAAVAAPTCPASLGETAQSAACPNAAA